MDEAAAATATELLVQTVNNLPLVPLLWTLLFQTIHKHSPPFPKLYRQFFMSTMTKKKKTIKLQSVLTFYTCPDFSFPELSQIGSFFFFGGMHHIGLHVHACVRRSSTSLDTLGYDACALNRSYAPGAIYPSVLDAGAFYAASD